MLSTHIETASQLREVFFPLNVLNQLNKFHSYKGFFNLCEYIKYTEILI